MRFLQLLCCLLFVSALSAQCPTLVWSDEFDGTSLNTDNWTYQTGDGCDIGICDWGNNEQQSYQQNNVSVANGVLSIVARREEVGGKFYSSGRINTKNKQEFRYGYLEARMKVPPGRGLWPAFWMLPTDEVYGFWPQSGEIDIMEWVGREPERLFGTLHFGQPVPMNQSTGVNLDLTDAAWSDEYHTYAVEWEENTITWYVDGYRYGSRTTANLNGQNWPFDQDFHFLLNMAVGGTFGGSVSNSAFPATMEVDYVRVYESRPIGFRGTRDTEEGETEVYIIDNLPEGAMVTYSAPEGATIIPDPDNPAVFRVTFGATTGVVSATVVSDCGEEVVGTQVTVAPTGLTKEFSFENFDDQELITFEFASGNQSEVNNPGPDAVNGSALSGRYVRDASSQFDVLVYGVTTIEDADDYVDGERAFVIDLYTDAPVGTELLLQLETNTALPDNFPAGRHSRYQVQTTKQNEWERLTFDFRDRPDQGTLGTRVENIILLFEPNTMNELTCYWDNFDSYSFDPNSVFSAQQLDFPLTVSPNPVQEEMVLSFTLPRAAEYDLNLYDLSGKRVLSLPGNQGLVGEQFQRVSLAGLPQGVYLAQLQFADGIRTIKVVRQ